MSEQEQLSTPSLLRRFAAIFYDSWLVFALLLACVGTMILIRIGVEGLDAMPQGKPSINGIWRIPTFILMLFALCHFYVYFWIKTGQTLGMQTWRIRLDNDQHERISVKQAYTRFFIALFSWASCGLGYLWMYIDKDKHTWHGRASNTRLVLLPKSSK
jgi:uncharacterized RDD family membrane protein YckC